VWIYIPSEFYPSAQELAESSLDLNSQSQLLEQFVMSRSKPLRAKYWLAAWKKKDWMQRLFGRILKPSMANLGAEKWIASLADIPASRLVLLEKNLDAMTQDTSGQTSNDSSQKSSHQSASLKMSPTIYELDLKKSQMTYDNWVIKLRQACLQRQKLARLTREKDYSSWPTVIVSDHLCNPTETPQRWKERAQEKKLEGINLHKPLRIVAQETWPTVVSADASMGAIISSNDTYKKTSTGRLRKINKNGKDGSLGLARTVKMMDSQKQNWPTVRTSSANGASSKEVEAGNPKQRLEVMIANWPTPRAQEPGSTSENYGKGLKNTAENWATPQARDWKDTANANVPTNSILGRQAPRTMKDGVELQMTLNPRFTEWLMGWPIGWTEFELAETEWCLWLQRMRGELSRMECILQKTIN
jgi:hypothetical protein